MNVFIMSIPSSKLTLIIKPSGIKCDLDCVKSIFYMVVKYIQINKRKPWKTQHSDRHLKDFVRMLINEVTCITLRAVKLYVYVYNY